MENDRALRTANNRVNARVRTRDQEMDTALAAIMEHAAGRGFVNWLLGLGRLGHNPFTNQALSTSFNCGELNVAQRVLDRVLRVAPDKYSLMLKEAENVRAGDQSILDAARVDPDAGSDD